jgi:hypothetical protein
MNLAVTAPRVCRPQRLGRDIFVVSASPATKPRQGRHISSARPPMPLLRSWNHFCTANYKYAAPLVLPKLRAATSDAEQAALQNTITAPDQQIDALVYDLYGLTDDEIKLVEGNA